MSRSIHTPLCDLLGIEVPILQAGMGMGARHALASAVSSAGGLGVIGGAALSPAELRAEIEAVRARTDRPMGVDLLFPTAFTGGAPGAANEALEALADLPPEVRAELDELEGLLTPGWVDAQVQVCLEAGVEVLVAGLGSAAPYMADAHAAGTRVLALSGTVDQALRHVDDGVDAVIASGADAGGHTGRIGSISLWAAVTTALADRGDPTPVIAAGGIGDGRGLAAALVLGCQGVWVGTRFLATEEADVALAAKERVVGMQTGDTVVTRAYSGKPMRVVRNEFTESWRDREHETAPFPVQVIATDGLARKGLLLGEVLRGAVPAGQGGGLVTGLLPAAEIVANMCAEACAALGHAQTLVSET